MEQRTIPILFALLRSAICGGALTDTEKARFSTQQLPELIAISGKHDLSHLLALSLKQNGLLSEENNAIGKNIFQAVYRYEQLNYEYVQVCSALEAAEIPFIPLKGSVLRNYYPEPWMRTSCDIDILVHAEDSEKAASILVDNRGYIYHQKGSHDIILLSPNKLHIELHYNLVEDGIANDSCEVLRSVWETAHIREGSCHWYEMPDEMFYFYHIAHMVKHFENGGCGIRPFIDLWILDHIEGAAYSKRSELLKQGNLLKFAQAAQKLSKVWFENAQTDSISQQMEDYILYGGVYGNNENRITVQQQKKGGQLRYAFSKIFIPYNVIKFHYPILQKYRWLTPIMEVRRWCKLIFCGHVKRTMRELKYSSNISDDKAATTQEFLKNLGLYG